MLIMPSSDINFQALADNITKGFFVDGVPLSDGVVKVAKEQSLTPEEIKRLVEKTNTAASLHLLKTASDKKGTFSLAQTELVLQQTHPASDMPEEKTASVYAGLPLPRKSEPTDSQEKTAAITQSEKPKHDVTTIFTLNRALDERKQQKVAEELKVRDRLDYLASEFNTWDGPDFHKFAHDCAVAFGSLCMPVINGLAEYLRVDTRSLIKKASEYREVVDDTTPHMVAMREICDGLGATIKLATEIEELNNARDYYWDGLKRGTL